MNLHATWFEWTFLIIGVVGLVTSILTWRDAVLDGLFLTAAGKNGVRKMVADQNVRQESYRLGTSTIMMFVGLAFILLEPPPPNYYELPQSLVGLIGWTTIAGIQVVNSLMDKSMRRRFSRIYDSPNPTDPQTGQPANSDRPVDNDPANAGSIGDDVRGLNQPTPAGPTHVVVDNVPLTTVQVDRRTPDREA